METPKTLTKSELLELIDRAFDGVPPPEKVTLHVAEAYDNYDTDNDERNRWRDYLGRWQDVPEEDVFNCYWALPHLDEQGIPYYLPRYMVAYLEISHDPDSGRGRMSDSTLYILSGLENEWGNDSYFAEKFSLVTPQQFHAFAKFVEYCAFDPIFSQFTDAPFAKRIYASYWKQFV